jgi:hypothetical protein
MRDEENEYAALFKRVVSGPGKSFVVFEHGTIVVFAGAAKELDLRAAAIELMKDYGPVHVGSPAGDFGVVSLPDGLGAAVTCHHNDILTLMTPDDLEGVSELAIGVIGRGKRGLDAEELNVVHVHDAR